MLNRQKGNMYDFVSHTWNVIKGRCPIDCSYCYMKRFKLKEPRFDEKELKTDLGENNMIFVGSSCDMWADEFPDEWISRILEHCFNHNNRYVFQTKNPKRFINFKHQFPLRTTLCTTLETNRGKDRVHRAMDMEAAVDYTFPETISMVTIEPIMDFDLEAMFELISNCRPYQVNIGADSGGNHLPEPSPQKLKELINSLKGYTKVHLKPNLKRLLKGGEYHG